MTDRRHRRFAALAARVVPDRVVFAPPGTEATDAYRAADAIVLASRGGDSMPAVLIEAGLMELPAIATPIEAIPEIVVPEVTGKLVPVGDVDGLARRDARAGRRSGSRADARSVGASALRGALRHRADLGGVGSRAPSGW